MKFIWFLHEVLLMRFFTNLWYIGARDVIYIAISFWRVRNIDKLKEVISDLSDHTLPLLSAIKIKNIKKKKNISETQYNST